MPTQNVGMPERFFLYFIFPYPFLTMSPTFATRLACPLMNKRLALQERWRDRIRIRLLETTLSTSSSSTTTTTTPATTTTTTPTTTITSPTTTTTISPTTTTCTRKLLFLKAIYAFVIHQNYQNFKLKYVQNVFLKYFIGICLVNKVQLQIKFLATAHYSTWPHNDKTPIIDLQHRYALLRSCLSTIVAS